MCHATARLCYAQRIYELYSLIANNFGNNHVQFCGFWYMVLQWQHKT